MRCTIRKAFAWRISPDNIIIKSHTNGTESQHTDISHDNNASITESQKTDILHDNNASITESFMITQTSITPDNTNSVIDPTSCPPDNIRKDAIRNITDSQQIDTSQYKHAYITQAHPNPSHNTVHVADVTLCPPVNITKDANTIITHSQETCSRKNKTKERTNKGRKEKSDGYCHF